MKVLGEHGEYSVSVDELRRHPACMVQIVYEYLGWKWAYLIWEFWHKNYVEHEYGLDTKDDLKSAKIRKWLEERRPKPPDTRGKQGEQVDTLTTKGNG